MDDKKKEAYMDLKNKILNIREDIYSLNADYNRLSNYLNKGLRVDNSIINNNDWYSIGVNQKYITDDINQGLLPVINRNINN